MAYFFIMGEFAVEILPTVELNTFISIGLKYFYSSIGEFDNHAYMIILTVGY